LESCNTEVVRNLMSSSMLAVSRLMSRLVAESVKRICDWTSGLSSEMGYFLSTGTGDLRSASSWMTRSRSKVHATW
jgi:hypothetical protein